VTVYSAIILYVIIWWLTLFLVLPWGVRRAEQPDHPSHAVEAPTNPRLLLKFAVTTVIAGLVFAAAWWMIEMDLISFREP
jgi:predicted secreted protein